LAADGATCKDIFVRHLAGYELHDNFRDNK
jgi:hypothetical protein